MGEQGIFQARVDLVERRERNAVHNDPTGKDSARSFSHMCKRLWKWTYLERFDCGAEVEPGPDAGGFD